MCPWLSPKSPRNRQTGIEIALVANARGKRESVGMNETLSLSANTAAILLFGGLAVALVSGLWSLVVAAQRSIWWLLAVIFIPFASIVILFVEPRSRKPFVIGLCAAIAVIVGIIGMDPTPHDSDTKVIREIKVALRDIKQQQANAAGSSELPLEVRKQRIVSWQKELEAKKAALQLKDGAARAAFDEEFKRYMTDLEKVKADVAKQPKN